MNYKIIQDRSALEAFINWLPELKQNEVFFLSLFARKKYSEDLQTSNNDNIAQFVCTKQNIMRSIKQLEVEIGAYEIGGVAVPQEALALYIHPNPRCTMKTAKMFAQKTVDMVFENHNAEVKPVKQLMAAFQKSPIAKKPFFDFDFDVNYGYTEMNKADHKQDCILEAYLHITENYVNKEAVTVVETRGGAHFIVSTDKLDGTQHKAWVLKVNQMTGIDSSGDILLPIPGCTQGGFKPRIKIT